jgi:S-adenosylmethionine hydrolase
MKGVILGICPAAHIIDVTHEIRPFDIAGAAFNIAQAYCYFPPKTVHVVVVDPGVGTARRPILVEAAGQFFIGPDNGVFALVLSRQKYRARAISSAKYLLETVSQTFHGRDVFAPAAAHLARGVSPSSIGKIITDPVISSSAEPVGNTGAVLHVDHFGNVITNFLASDFPRPFVMTVGSRKVSRQAADYQSVAPGELFVIAGSSGYLEISAREASAAKILKIAAGAPVKLNAYRRSRSQSR